jgi:hypothetical protein
MPSMLDLLALMLAIATCSACQRNTCCAQGQRSQVIFTTITKEFPRAVIKLDLSRSNEFLKIPASLKPPGAFEFILLRLVDFLGLKVLQTYQPFEFLYQWNIELMASESSALPPYSPCRYSTNR